MNPPLPEPARRPPPVQQQSQNLVSGDDLPETASQFCGWLNKQSEDVKRQVKRLTSAWALKSLYKTWSNADVAAVVRELTRERNTIAPPPVRDDDNITLSDHELFMIRHARKQAEEKATAAAWAAQAGRGAYPVNNGNGRH
jgi:hypothetical protein